MRRLLVRRLLVRRLLVWGGITAFLAHIYLAEGGGCQCSKRGCQCSKRGCQPIGTQDYFVGTLRSSYSAAPCLITEDYFFDAEE